MARSLWDRIADRLLNRNINKNLEAMQENIRTLEAIIRDIDIHSRSMENCVENDVLPKLNAIDVFTRSYVNSYITSLEDISRTSVYQKLMTLRGLFSVADVADSLPYCRIGRANDGGYVMLDDFSHSRVAYSFGISDDVSWDMGMAERGLQVYMYDHTIDHLPYENPNFHYTKLGIGGSVSKDEPNLKTLSDFLKMNGHENEDNMILKLDVEGAEWDFLAEIPLNMLAQFRQIVIEFHNLNHPSLESQIIDSVRHISQVHQLVHIHANNHGGGRFIGTSFMPDVLEATYLNRDVYRFSPSQRMFPGSLDQPNCAERPDMLLGTWVSYRGSSR